MERLKCKKIVEDWELRGGLDQMLIRGDPKMSTKVASRQVQKEDLLAEIKVMKEAKDYYGADRELGFQ